MEPDEIRRRQQQLEADQKLWAARKLEIQDEIKRGNATLDVLMPKLTATKTELERVRAELTTVNNSKATFIRESATLEGEALSLGRANADSRQTLADLDELIAQKQTRIDEGLSDYVRKRKAELNTQLAEVDKFLGQKHEELAGLQIQVDAKRGELASTLTTLTQERDRATQERSDAEQELSHFRAQLPEQQGLLEAVERKFKQASYQLKEVQTNLEKARIEHQSFLEYEARARKLLATKDRELQDKRDELEVTARHVGNRRSFLSEL